MHARGHRRQLLRRAGLGALVYLHVFALVIGISLYVNARYTTFYFHASYGLPVPIFCGLCLAQSSLLAVWLTLGTERLLYRALGTAAGVLAVSVAVIAATGLRPGVDDLWLGFFLSAPAALVAMMSLVARRMGLVLLPTWDAAPPAGKLSVQFGIRDIMIATLLIALLLAALQFIGGVVTHLVWYLWSLTRIQGISFSLGRELGFLAAAIYSVGTTFAILWLILGRSRFRFRMLAILAVAIIIATSYYIDMRWGLAEILAAQAVIEVATLLVLRAMGFRLAVVEGRSGPPA